jgi:SAM-dependent methyltransferase
VISHLELNDRSKTVLDVGCGSGWTTKLLAQRVKEIWGIDISWKSLQLVSSILGFNGIDNGYLVVADCEKLPFAEASFDCVFGHAVLHHLELEPALETISRVLREGGRGAFAEPMAHNPLVNLYRLFKERFFARYRGTDRPLVYDDRRVFTRYFRKVNFVPVAFLSDRVPALRRWERWVLGRLPFTGKWASLACILVEK